MSMLSMSRGQRCITLPFESEGGNSLTVLTMGNEMS